MNNQNRDENVKILGQPVSANGRHVNKKRVTVLALGAVFIGIAGISIIAVFTSHSKMKVEETNVALHVLYSQAQVGDRQRILNDENYRLQIVNDILDRVPLIDGHNDWPMVIRGRVKEELSAVDLRSDLRSQWGSFTDIPGLRQGRVGGQFWSVYCGCSAQYKDAVEIAIEQIALVKSITKRYPDVFQLVTNAADIQKAHSSGRIASMLGMEGGHMIGESLGMLAQYHELGVRYLTLTHNCNTLWAESCCDNNPKTPVTGLTAWGKLVIHELNRLGIFVDISHVSPNTMSDVLDTSVSPVIFSHSSALALCDHPRNVPDYILKRMKNNGGIVMVNFAPDFINCSSSASIYQIADHVDYIKNVAGVNHIGIGGDYEGFVAHPTGLEDVSKYPLLFSELLRRDWAIEELEKLAGLNLIRAFSDMEKVRDSLVNELAEDKNIGEKIPDQSCATS